VYTQIDRRIDVVSGSSAFRWVEPASVLVCKTVSANGNPAENYDYCATQQSSEKHDFEHAHREYCQPKGHDWTFLYGAKSFYACRSPLISTVQRQSSPKLFKRLIAVNREHPMPQTQFRQRAVEAMPNSRLAHEVSMLADARSKTMGTTSPILQCISAGEIVKHTN